MNKRKKLALEELDDIYELICELMRETSKSRCGYMCGMDEAVEELTTIRNGIVKPKKGKKAHKFSSKIE